MRRALALAERGRGTTRPNPCVGAVIARGGRILADGFHRRAGEAHAELNALARLSPGAARGATLYVNLEPCCHTGRTGPCTDAIIAAGIARVVVGCRDPNPLVDGRGIGRLRRAGIQVDLGCLEDACRAANRAFALWVREGRPLVTLKAASTLDGFIAPQGPRARRGPVWITGPAARRVAHQLRAAHDAVLIGSGTLLADDPQLTVRLGRSRRRAGGPLRVVLDRRLRTPPDARVLRGAPTLPTLIVTARGASAARGRALRAAGAEILELPPALGRLTVPRVLRALARRDIRSVLVEGGAGVHGAFIASGLVDEVALFYAPRLLGRGVPFAVGGGRGLHLGPVTVRAVGNDILLTAQARPKA
jgi:diaminohydroxyphosphoribosylaminopyrimidine deaminase / 5-amino-6-(5-phosphoribosylamino)uracil reductase